MACEKEKDYVSRDMLLKILESEEEHADHLSTQISLVEKVGDENFLQTQISSASSA
jgi:Bacterioferritin (cytochrome b1)